MDAVLRAYQRAVAAAGFQPPRSIYDGSAVRGVRTSAFGSVPARAARPSDRDVLPKGVPRPGTPRPPRECGSPYVDVRLGSSPPSTPIRTVPVQPVPTTAVVLPASDRASADLLDVKSITEHRSAVVVDSNAGDSRRSDLALVAAGPAARDDGGSRIKPAAQCGDNGGSAGVTLALEAILSNGTDEQKDLVEAFIKIARTVDAAQRASLSVPLSLGGQEMKFFMAEVAAFDCNTDGTYAAGSYRFPVFFGHQSVPAGTGVNQRIGNQIKMHRFELDLRFCAFTTRQDAVVPTPSRSHTIKFALWRQKIALVTPGAVDITAFTTGPPVNAGPFYWDPFDGAARTSASIDQDTSMFAMHNINAVARHNNHCMEERTVNPLSASTAIGAAGGVINLWSTYVDTSQKHDCHGYFSFKHDLHGMPANWNDATTNNPINNRFYFMYLTDKPQAGVAGTQAAYSAAYTTKLWFTDA